MNRRILIVDDDPLKRAALHIELGEHGYDVHEAGDAATAQRTLDAQPLDAVVADMQLPDLTGLDLLTYIRQVHSALIVILTSAYPSVADAVRAIKHGAADFLTKPFTTADLLASLGRTFAVHPAAAAPAAAPARFGPLLAGSALFRRTLTQLEHAAASDAPLLLCGEPGTGKATAARALHDAGPRANGPFVHVPCAAVPPDDATRTLFGAPGGRGGRLSAATRGTLLLDGLEHLPRAAQAQLARHLTTTAAPRAARLVATSAGAPDLLVERRLLDDARAAARRPGALVLPPLRARPADIVVLARHFAAQLGRQADAAGVTLSAAALEELTRLPWPGNVRELAQTIERAVALCGNGAIGPEHLLPLPLSPGGGAPAPPTPLAEQGLNDVLADVERRLLLIALRACDGNQGRAAARLGIPRTTLRDKITKYNLA